METIRTATVDLGKTVRFIFTGPNHHQRAEMARNFVADALKGELWLGAGVLCTDLTAGKSAFILRSSAGPALGEINGKKTREIVLSLGREGAGKWFNRYLTGDGDDILSRLAA